MINSLYKDNSIHSVNVTFVENGKLPVYYLFTGY